MKPERDPRIDERLLAALAGQTVDDALFLRGIRRSVFLEQYKHGEVRRFVGFLNSRVFPDLLDKLEARLRRIEDRGFDTGLDSTQRLKDLAVELRGVLAAGIRAGDDALHARMQKLAISEGAWQLSMLQQTVPLLVTFRGANVRLLQSIVEDRPFAGNVLKKWAETITTTTQQRVERAINIGLAQGETSEQIVRRLRGTRARGFADGALQATRSEAAMVVRTAVGHISAHAREATAKANSDVIAGVRWVSTLDPKTCFPAGTRVMTRRGWEPIETVRVGDEVLTHRGRFRRVLATRAKTYTGRLATIVVGRRKLTATADHRIMTPGGWREIGGLSVREEVVLLKESAQLIDEIGTERAGEGLGRQSDQLEACCDHSGSLAAIPAGGVPVLPVNLESNPPCNEEVDRVAAQLLLRDERHTELLKRRGDLALWKCWRNAAPIAGETAEAALAGSPRTNPDDALARLANQMHRRTAADLRAELSVVAACDEKARAAAPAVAVGRGPTLAGQRADRVAVRVTLRHIEGAPALSALFPNSLLRGVFQETRARAINALTGALSSIERLATAWTGSRESLPTRGGVVALAGAEPSLAFAQGSRTRNEAAMALSAGAFHAGRISSVASHASTIVVYDLQVEDDQTFVAEGIVVHNCPICANLDGTIFPIGEGRRPPAHLRCRCDVVPKSKTWKQLGINLPEAPEGTRAAFGGPVRGGMTYADWFDEQSDAVKRQIVGPGRLKLIKAGEADLSDLVNNQGRILTLDELDEMTA